MLNNPAVVPDTDAKGNVNAIVGVELAFVTVEVNVLPLAVTVIGFTLLTVPPLPVAAIVIDPTNVRLYLIFGSYFLIFLDFPVPRTFNFSS